MEKILHTIYGLLQQITRLDPYPRIVVKAVCALCEVRCVRDEIESVYRSPEKAVEEAKVELLNNHPQYRLSDIIFIAEDKEYIVFEIPDEDGDDDDDYEEYVDEEELYDDDDEEDN